MSGKGKKSSDAGGSGGATTTEPKQPSRIEDVLQAPKRDAETQAKLSQFKLKEMKSFFGDADVKSSRVSIQPKKCIEKVGGRLPSPTFSHPPPPFSLSHLLLYRT